MWQDRKKLLFRKLYILPNLQTAMPPLGHIMFGNKKIGVNASTSMR